MTTARICRIDGCERQVRPGGTICNMHHSRLRRHGTTEIKSRQDHFWERVEKTQSCWLWRGRLNSAGYGMFGYECQQWRAHRLSYTWSNGPIPDGLEIDHKCHVRNCVNPAHLQAVSGALNNQNLRQENPHNLTSGLRGIHWNKRERKWQVYAKVDGRRHQAGYFTSLDEAKAAAVALRNRLMTNNLDDRRSA